MKRAITSLVFFLVTYVFISLPVVVNAFNEAAHVAISRRSVDPRFSKLDGILKLRLGDFPSGTAEIVNNRSVRQWIEKGSSDEDDPATRVQEHFHNPTLQWNQAGLSGVSAVLWAQQPNQDASVPGGGNHSWKDARDSYYQALTQATKADRGSDV